MYVRLTSEPVVYLVAFFVVLVANLCLTCNPWTVAHQASLSIGFPRQEYWSGLPFPAPGESSPPRDQTWCLLPHRWSPQGSPLPINCKVTFNPFFFWPQTLYTLYFVPCRLADYWCFHTMLCPLPSFTGIVCWWWERLGGFNGEDLKSYNWHVS